MHKQADGTQRIKENGSTGPIHMGDSVDHGFSSAILYIMISPIKKINKKIKK